MKRFLLILTALVLATGADLTPQQKYISEYKALAQAEMRRSGVPASIILAQGILESDCGRSKLAVKGNNHFGIKCNSSWTGKKMYHDDDRKGECFRVYPAAEASYRDHSDFLRYSQRYKSLFNLAPTDYKGWAKGLKAAGYATDPSYPAKIVKIIEDYRLFDYDKSEPVPESPESIEIKSSLPAAISAGRFEYSIDRTSRSANGVPFLIAVEGDSYESVARDENLFLKELLSFNDLDAVCELTPGTVVYLQMKKSKAPKGLDKYVVQRDGERLRDICQLFAVRQKSIQKLNGLDGKAVLKEGDTVLLR